MATNYNGGLSMDYSPLHPIGEMTIDEFRALVPKGDPGGIVDGTWIGAAADLNTLTVSGEYRTGGLADATFAKNYPIENVYVKVMVRAISAALFMQEVTPISGTANGRVFFRRLFTSGAFQPWQSFSASRVDQTAGRVIYEWDALNNREQITYADTGMRQLGSNLLNGWTAVNPTDVNIRRIGSMVYFNGVLDNTGATSDVFFTVPVGFRPFTGSYAQIQGATNTGTWRFARVTWDGHAQQYRTTTGVQNVSGVWTTTEAWPAVLPGTANGAVPNL